MRLVPSYAALTRLWQPQEGLTILEPISSQPKPVRLSSASRIISSTSSGNTITAFEKVIFPARVNNADPATLPSLQTAVSATRGQASEALEAARVEIVGGVTGGSVDKRDRVACERRQARHRPRPCARKRCRAAQGVAMRAGGTQSAGIVAGVSDRQ